MILEAANGGATKTKIMYKAFLSYAQLREYLSVLIENNLLEYLEGSQTYKTTEKGLNFLKIHNEIGELLQTSIKESTIENALFFLLFHFLFFDSRDKVINVSSPSFVIYSLLAPGIITIYIIKGTHFLKYH